MERYASTASICLEGAFASRRIAIEACFRRGLPGFQLAGHGRGGAREIPDRLRTAIASCGLRFPVASLLVSLSPVDLRPRGAFLDLAMAAAILKALGAAPPTSLLARLPEESAFFAGELSLSGALLPVERLVALLWHARRHGFRSAVVPEEQLPLARMVPGLELYGARSLEDLLAPPQPDPVQSELRLVPAPASAQLAHLRLEEQQLRTLAAAAAGWHSLLMIGPPGAGKSSLARELGALLPPADPEELLEILIARGEGDAEAAAAEELSSGNAPLFAGNPTGIQPEGSLLTGSGELEVARPFRAPHHSASARAILGGGIPPQPGEISRAHRGVLFLDEMAEFDRDALQGLREPLEEGCIRLARGGRRMLAPARFLFVGAANPCPCGYYGEPSGQCFCSTAMVRSAFVRLLGPLRDRIDLELPVRSHSDEAAGPERVAAMRKQIIQAAETQRRRYAGSPYRFNSEVLIQDLERLIPLESPRARREWEACLRARLFSHRSMAGLRRTARTLADLDGCAQVDADHLTEAAWMRNQWSRQITLPQDGASAESRAPQETGGRALQKQKPDKKQFRPDQKPGAKQ